MYWENPASGWQAIREGDWKAHRLQTRRPGQTAIELYNLATDEAETTDVASGHPDRVARFEELFSTARTAPVGKIDELFAPPKSKKKKQGKNKPK